MMLFWWLKFATNPHNAGVGTDLEALAGVHDYECMGLHDRVGVAESCLIIFMRWPVADL